uniref:Uncharacterized protein n=1 Tax=Anguilla anguilla TaxID=7936 RepID=A0A0E9WG47_ANGAN
MHKLIFLEGKPASWDSSLLFMQGFIRAIDSIKLPKPHSLRTETMKLYTRLQGLSQPHRPLCIL